MKSFNRSVFILALNGMLILFNSAIAQSNSEPGDFKINVGYEKNQVLLKCEYGCAWTELNFSLRKSDPPQFVNEMGMTSKEDEQQTKPGLAHFLFSFYKMKKKMKCESVFGTRWGGLEFSCREATCNADIDKNGVVVKN